MMDEAMLRDSVSAEMAKLGLDISIVPSLGVDKLSQIENAVSSSDDQDRQRGRIEQIVAE